MLVKTDYMTSAGEGTPLFSKFGALTRYQHMAFIDKNFHSNRG